ncbi:MAG: FAD-dependent oxidoreductase [Elusimicrobiales bacterium]
MERIKKHPIIDITERKEVEFYFDGKRYIGYEGEAVSSALIANGINIFSYHKKDSVPQGIFCANGQCAQCSVVIDGRVLKACITPLHKGMNIETLRGAAKVKPVKKDFTYSKIEEIETDVLVVGGGPSGMSCAIELGRFNLDVMIVDDKSRLGGKLLLQTHKFFGSVDDCYAGTRGIDIADRLEHEINKYPSIKVLTESVVFGVFSDKKIGVIRENEVCYLIKPKVVVFATGAREKMLLFEGNTLVGVYGAGAFQTLINRDLVKPCKRIFIVGGGNVGLIAAYHALQAGIDVVGLCEIFDRCSGYKVHEDKIKRLGVKIFTRHTIVRAEGNGYVERVIIAEVDEKYRIKEGTYKIFDVDTILVAAGLLSVNELYEEAKKFGIPSYVCGDAHEVAEASAAMFSGKIAAHNVLKHLGFVTNEVPKFWYDKLEILKSRPGKYEKRRRKSEGLIYPVIHCYEEIPCNPCVTVCPKKSIKLSGATIMSTPYFDGECIGCFRCLVICPGLAITIVDKRRDRDNPIVWLPVEFDRNFEKGMKILATDEDGDIKGEFEIEDVRNFKADKTLAVAIRVPSDIADEITSLRMIDGFKYTSIEDIKLMPDTTVVCRCERVSLGEIRKWIRKGVKDLNQLKSLTRVGMGACGGKTCSQFLLNIMRSEGVSHQDVTSLTQRPFFVEVSIASLAGINIKEEKTDDFSNF